MLKRDPKSGIWKGEWNYFINGRRQRIRRSSGTKVKHLAEEWHRRMDEELWRVYRLGVVVRFWEDAVVGYMKNREGRASFSADLARLKWLDPHLKGKRVDDIDADLLTDIRDARLEEVGPSTTNRMMTLISAVLHYAEEREWITRAPRIPKAVEEERDPVWLTPDEVTALINVMASRKRTKHLVAFITFAVATGLRMSNITGLKWSQVDLARRVLWVPPSSSKNRRPISVPLAYDARAIIRDQIGRHQEYVFTYRGKPFDRVNNRTLRKAAEEAGIEKRVHNHLFRHTFASWHVMGGTSLYDLMKLGGWRKIESVMIYAHLSAEHMQQAASNRAMVDAMFTHAKRLMD